MAKKAKRGRGQPKKIVGDIRAKIIKKIEEGCTLNSAVASVGIGGTTFYDTRRRDEEFDRQVEEAKQRRLARLEQEANKRALDGSDTLIKFLLQAYDRETYCNPLRHEHSGPEGKPIETNATISLEGLTDDECRSLVAILEKAKAAEPGNSQS